MPILDGLGGELVTGSKIALYGSVVLVRGDGYALIELLGTWDRDLEKAKSVLIPSEACVGVHTRKHRRVA